MIDKWAEALRTNGVRNPVDALVPPCPWPKGPIEVWGAGDDLVTALIPYANGYAGIAPLWHGWAVRDAYIAGYRAAFEAVQISTVRGGPRLINAVDPNTPSPFAP